MKFTIFENREHESKPPKINIDEADVDIIIIHPVPETDVGSREVSYLKRNSRKLTNVTIDEDETILISK